MQLKPVKNKLIVIVGPTAVGKTAVAIALAKQLKNEIISADSRQIYREMNIGTAKPSEADLSAIPHHFINSHSINETYDAAQYGRDALNCIHQLFEKHKTLILCGGSGLYVKAVCEGFDDMPEIDGQIRLSLTENFKQKGIEWLQQEMIRHDPEHFANIDSHNSQRLMRALEVKLGTGCSIATFQNKSKLQHSFDIIKIGLEVNRDELYKRINSRMDVMIEMGLFEEAVTLYSFKENNALKTVGYQEIFDFIDGKYDREEAIRLLKRNTRRYAKRQLTWFKRDEEIVWFDCDEIDAIVKFIE